MWKSNQQQDTIGIYVQGIKVVVHSGPQQPKLMKIRILQLIHHIWLCYFFKGFIFSFICMYF